MNHLDICTCRSPETRGHALSCRYCLTPPPTRDPRLDLIALFDAAEDRMADALRSAGWRESESDGRWTAPDGTSLRLAAAFERARMDAVSAWRAGR